MSAEPEPDDAPLLDPLERATLDVLAEVHGRIEAARAVAVPLAPLANWGSSRANMLTRPILDEMLLGMMEAHHCALHERNRDAEKPLLDLAARAIIAAALIREGRP